MSKKTRKEQKEREQIQISFVKQNKQLSIQQNRLNVQILRVHTIQKQRSIMNIFNLSQQQLCQFFSCYQVFPYSPVININTLLQSPLLKLIKNNQKIYFGLVSQKRRQGKGINITSQGKIYQGQFVNNQKSGKSIQIYANGNLFLGQFNNGKKHGNGQFFWFNLSSKNPQHDQYVEYYQGEWWGGLPDGQGIHQKINGDFYTGSFKNGLKHGQGIEYFGNQDTYKGQYVNGLPEGYGEYVWSDHSYYKGDFKQGLRNGYGVWGFSNDSNQKYKGHYSMDKKSGYGVYQWDNGWTYKGNFQNDFRNGFGELYDGDKLTYRGFWQNGQQTDKQVKSSKQIASRKSQILTKNSSQIYKRSSGLSSRVNRNPNLGRNLNQEYQRQQNPQRMTMTKRGNKSATKRTTNRQQNWFGDFGTIQHQADFVLKRRPQSFNSAANKRQLVSQKKGSKQNINMNKMNMSKTNRQGTIGSSISKPLINTLYVPYRHNPRYQNRNFC